MEALYRYANGCAGSLVALFAPVAPLTTETSPSASKNATWVEDMQTADRIGYRISPSSTVAAVSGTSL